MQTITLTYAIPFLLYNSIQCSKIDTQWFLKAVFPSDGHHFEVVCETEINIPIQRRFRDTQNGRKTPQ